MTVCPFPMDTERRMRLLQRLDLELLEYLAQMIEAIDRMESIVIKDAVAPSIGTLLLLATEIPAHSAQTQYGLRVRDAIRHCCVEIGQIALRHRAGSWNSAFENSGDKTRD